MSDEEYEKIADELSNEYRKHCMECGMQDPVALDEIEEAHYLGLLTGIALSQAQGVTFEYNLIGRNTIEGLDMKVLAKAGIHFGDKVIVQICKA